MTTNSLSNNEENQNKIIDLLTVILSHIEYLHQEVLDLMFVYNTEPSQSS